MKKKNKNKESVAFKVRSLITAIAVISAILVGAVTIIVGARTVQLNIEKDLTAFAGEVKSAVEANLQADFYFLDGYAKNAIVYDLDVDPVAQKAEFKRVAAERNIADIGFAPASGQTLTANMETYADISQREYFIKALSGQRFASDPFEDSVNPGTIIQMFSVPVYRDGDSSTGEIVGVLYQKQDGNFLSNITNGVVFGETGFAYMTDSEGVNIAYMDPEVVLAQENPITDYADRPEMQDLIKVLKEILATDTGFRAYKYGNQRVCVGFATIDEFNWKVVVGQDSNEIMSGLRSGVILSIICVIVISIITSVVSIIAANKIANPLTTLTQVNNTLVEGHLDVDFDTSKQANDEIGKISNSTKEFAKMLRDIIGKSKRSSMDINAMATELTTVAGISADASDAISKAIQEIASESAAQAAEVEQASNQINNLSEAVDAVKTHVERLSELAKQTNQAEENAGSALKDLITSNDKTTTAIHEIAAEINRTSEYTDEISNAANLITEIASQTNLLSLNASIEAARAGEAGKGFAVVATEIQALSTQSNQAASTIQGIINNLKDGAERSNAKMGETLTYVKEQQEKLGKTKESSDITRDNLTYMVDSVKSIKENADICEEVKTKVSATVANLTLMSEQYAAAAQESMASMEELNANIGVLSDNASSLEDITTDLSSQMEFWKV